MAANANADNILVILGITKFISLTMLRVASKSFISFIGIALNLDLVYVTFRTKSIHGTCNILIALNALFTAFFEFSYITEFIITINKLNPVKLTLCFFLQLFPLFGANCATVFILFIGVDRFITTALPTWQNRINHTYYLMVIIAVCWTYSLFVVYAAFQVDFSSTYDNKTVGCQVSDLYRDEVASMTSTNNIILNLATVACYVGVWILIKATKRDVSSRFFKSCIAIMLSVTLGWSLISIANIIIGIFQLTTTPQWYLLFTVGILQSAADASHAPILYVFSNQYKHAFRDQFDRIAVIFRLRKIRQVIQNHSTVLQVTPRLTSSEDGRMMNAIKIAPQRRYTKY
ncbi:serpentine type 7TM GPCR chemoreceptor srsx domain-containing protein [Ditylenchus destructor]|nr:serpentine type 7TM GPCR chemoreceptor srsx domain-containing protein [Ditylenchus destructor]